MGASNNILSLVRCECPEMMISAGWREKRWACDDDNLEMACAALLRALPGSALVQRTPTKRRGDCESSWIEGIDVTRPITEVSSTSASSHLSKNTPNLQGIGHADVAW